MASKVKVDTIEQQGSSGIVISDDIKLSSGKAIKNASGTALLGEDGALGSGVTGAGSWIKLETQTISGTPTTVTIGWDSVADETRFTSAYKIYKIICTDIKAGQSGGMALTAQVCHSGTTAYTGSLYDNVYNYQKGNDSTMVPSRENSQDHWHNFGGTDIETTDATSSQDLEITVCDPSSATRWKKAHVNSMGWDDSSSTSLKFESLAVVRASNALTAIIFSWIGNAGGETFADGGIISLYGIA